MKTIYKEIGRHCTVVILLLMAPVITFSNPHIWNVQSYLSPNPRFDIEIRTNLDRNITRVERRELNDALQTMEISIYMLECNPVNVHAFVDTTIYFESEFPEEVLILLFLDSTSCGFRGEITLADSLRLRGGQPVGVSEVQSLESKIHPTLIETGFSISPELGPNECLKLYTEDGKLVQEFCEAQSGYSLQNLIPGRYVAVIEERNYRTRIVKK